jgi:beta-glucosidase
MTAYNRINGPWSADSPLLADVLRGEWGFDGLVMSDWFGLHSTAEGVQAGLDLEMPGPTLHRGQQLLDAIDSGAVSVADVRACARKVLELMDRTGALHADGPAPETTRYDAQDIELVRRIAAQGMVLLRNVPVVADHALLPLQLEGVRRVALIGPNVALGEIMGGGSAHVTPTGVSTPLDALTEYFAVHGVEVVHRPGCQIHRALPELNLRRTAGMTVDIFGDPADLDDPDATPLHTGTTGTMRLMWVSDPTGRGAANPLFGVRLTSVFTPDVAGEWKLGVESVSPARIILDGTTLLDNTDVPIGGSFFGMGRDEAVVDVAMEAGREYALVIEMRHTPVGTGMGGINIGALAPVHGDLLADAVDAAADADLSIVVVGTNDNWESEGWDRTTLELPGRQDELVRRVAEVSAATVVVVNAGSPITMPWLADVHAVLLAWFPGQEMGNALVDLLSGAVEPQGRLPVTFPFRLEDTPAFEHHPWRNAVADYREGRLVGHQWYDTVGREPLFPFGFGLGYGSTHITDIAALDPYTVECTVTAGGCDAVEVVQVYAHLLDRDDIPRDEPEQRLVGFVKVIAPAGTSQRVTIGLDPDGYRRWDLDAHAWSTQSCRHELRIGRSSRDIVARVEVVS